MVSQGHRFLRKTSVNKKGTWLRLRLSSTVSVCTVTPLKMLSTTARCLVSKWSTRPPCLTWTRTIFKKTTMTMKSTCWRFWSLFSINQTASSVLTMGLVWLMRGFWRSNPSRVRKPTMTWSKRSKKARLLWKFRKEPSVSCLIFQKWLLLTRWRKMMKSRWAIKPTWQKVWKITMPCLTRTLSWIRSRLTMQISMTVWLVKRTSTSTVLNN